jgi:hypothetical protein
MTFLTLPGPYFNHVTAQVNCQAPFKNEFIDRTHGLPHAPKVIPKHLMSDFTMNGRLKVYEWYFDQPYVIVLIFGCFDIISPYSSVTISLAPASKTQASTQGSSEPMNGRLKVYEWYFDQPYLEKKALSPVWSKEMVEQLITLAKQGQLGGNYGKKCRAVHFCCHMIKVWPWRAIT